MQYIGTMKFESVVRPEHQDFSLLDSLVARFSYHSREEWEKLIVQEKLKINGKVAGLESTVKKGDQILYLVENYTEPEVPTHFEVIHEDDDFMLVDKPAGVPIHRTGRIFFNTFTSILRRHFDNEELSPMHRLDRDTGGLILFAKNKDISARFQKHLDKILLKKIYIAVVHGRFPDHIHRVDMALQEKSDSEIRLKMYASPSGKASTTLFRLQKIIEKPFGLLEPPFSVLEAELITGRKHQIRAHLSELGYPIVADRLYAHQGVYYKKMLNTPLTASDLAVLGSKHQMLHAYKVQLYLPHFKEAKYFESHAFHHEMKSILSL